jgi:hypothetical protein
VKKRLMFPDFDVEPGLLPPVIVAFFTSPLSSAAERKASATAMPSGQPEAHEDDEMNEVEPVPLQLPFGEEDISIGNKNIMIIQMNELAFRRE